MRAGIFILNCSSHGTLRPAIGFRPTAIGVRQLIVSSLFTLLFILTWGMVVT